MVRFRQLYAVQRDDLRGFQQRVGGVAEPAVGRGMSRSSVWSIPAASGKKSVTCTVSTGVAAGVPAAGVGAAATGLTPSYDARLREYLHEFGEKGGLAVTWQ